jgi:hypothetical protein
MPRYLVERTFADGLQIPADERPNPEAIRSAAARNGLPIDRISEVRVLDPYLHH